MTDAGRVFLPWVKAALWERGNLFVLNKEFRRKLRRKLNNGTSNVILPLTQTKKERRQTCLNSGEAIAQCF